jgi:hypothetical protein
MDTVGLALRANLPAPGAQISTYDEIPAIVNKSETAVRAKIDL